MATHGSDLDQHSLSAPTVDATVDRTPTPVGHTAPDTVDRWTVGALTGALGNTETLEILHTSDPSPLQGMARGCLELGLAGIAVPELVPGSGSLAVARAMLARVGPTADLAQAEQVIRRGGGQRLPEAVRVRLERAFGQDLSGVRVHTDGLAADAADALSARAFTVDHDIYFGSGEWDPSGPEGLELLAHELTHVVQSEQGRLPAPRGPGLDVSSPTDPHEREAEARGAEVAQALVADVYSALDSGDDSGDDSGNNAGSDADAAPAEASGAALASRETTPEGKPQPGVDPTVQNQNAPVPGPQPRQPLPEQDPPGALPPVPVAQPEAVDDVDAQAPDLSTTPTAALEADDAADLAADDAHPGDPPPADLSPLTRYASATPSNQALLWRTLGADLSAQAARAAEDTSATFVPFRASIPVEQPEVRRDPRWVAHTSFDPTPELQPAEKTTDPPQTLGTYEENKAIHQPVLQLPKNTPEADKQKVVGQTLAAIQTQDALAAASLGPAPSSPPQAATGPAQLAQWRDQALAEASRKAEQLGVAVSVLSGQAAPTCAALLTEVPLGALHPPVVPDPPSVPEMDDLGDYNLPPAVLAAFDAQQGPALQQAQAPALQAMQQVDQTRDDAFSNAEDQGVDQAINAQTDALLAAGAQERALREKADQTATDVQTRRTAAIDALTATVRAEQATRDKALSAEVAVNQAAIGKIWTQAETGVARQVATAESEAARKKEAVEKAAQDRSWWEQALDVIAGCLSALADAISAVFDAARVVIAGIVEAARSEVAALIQGVVALVQAALQAFATLLKATLTVLLSQTFPALLDEARATIDAAVAEANTAIEALGAELVAGVNSFAAWVQATMDAALAAWGEATQGVLKLAESLAREGWSGVLDALIDTALSLAGLSRADLDAFLGSGADVLSVLLEDPGSFLGNCIDALTTGVGQFADHFLDHLATGFGAWITGALGGVGVALPAALDAGGLFTLVCQVLGLTADAFRGRAVRLLGEENVGRIEAVATMVADIQARGFGVIYERVQEGLGDLWGAVVGKLQDFLMNNVLTAAITKVLAMFSPVSALVEGLRTLMNLAAFLRDQMGRILGVLSAITSSIASIAQGAIGFAAGLVEGALAQALPVALDLFASLLGLKGIDDKIREVIEGARGWVDKAIDGLLQQLQRVFGKRSGEDGIGDGEIGETVAFEAAGEQHHLWVEVDLRVMVASKPTPVADRLRQWSAQLQADPNLLAPSDGTSAAPREEAQALIAAAQQKLGLVDTSVQAAHALLPAARQPSNTNAMASFSKADDAAELAQRNLASVIARLFELFGGQNTLRHKVYRLIGTQVCERHQTQHNKPDIALGLLPMDHYEETVDKGGVYRIAIREEGRRASAPVVHADAQGLLREGPDEVDKAAGQAFGQRFGIGDVVQSSVAILPGGVHTPGTVPPPREGPPTTGYVVLCVGTPGAGIKDVAMRYYNEAWSGEDRQSGAVGARMGVVAAINTFESLSADQSRKKVIDAAGAVRTPPGVAVDSFPFLWRPQWYQKDSHGKPTQVVPFETVQAAFAELPNTARAAALAETEGKTKWGQGPLPYGLFREVVVTSPYTQQQVMTLRQHNDPVVQHFTDPDAMSLKVVGGQGVIERYNAILDQMATHPVLLIGGYNFEHLRGSDNLADQLTLLAQELDHAVRSAIASAGDGSMLYPTEPNMLLQAHNQAEGRDLYADNKTWTGREGYRKLKVQGSLFGHREIEGYRLRQNLMRSGYVEKDQIAWKPEASIPTDALPKNLSRGLYVDPTKKIPPKNKRDGQTPSRMDEETQAYEARLSKAQTPEEKEVIKREHAMQRMILQEQNMAEKDRLAWHLLVSGDYMDQDPHDLLSKAGQDLARKNAQLKAQQLLAEGKTPDLAKLTWTEARALVRAEVGDGFQPVEDEIHHLASGDVGQRPDPKDTPQASLLDPRLQADIDRLVAAIRTALNAEAMAGVWKDLRHALDRVKRQMPG